MGTINSNPHLTEDEREKFYTVYDNLSSAKGMILIDRLVDRNALRLLGAAVRQAKFEMPDDIEKYAENLCDTAVQAYSARLVLDKKDEYFSTTTNKRINKEKIEKEHKDLILKIEKSEDPLKIFSKYLKIKIN